MKFFKFNSRSWLVSFSLISLVSFGAAQAATESTSDKDIVVSTLARGLVNSDRQLGLAIGRHLSPQGILQFEVSTKGYESPSINSRIHANVAYKYFMTKSFFIKGGVDYMNLSFYQNVDSTYGYGFDGSNISALGAIGNEWTFAESWFVSIEWFSIVAPITWQTSNEASKSGSDYEAASMNNDQKTYLKDPKSETLKIYVGYRF